MLSQAEYCGENACNILLLFVSPVSERSMKEPPEYHIFFHTYTCVQTNESAVIYCREMLGGGMPDKIFLIASDMVRKEGDTPYGRMPHLTYLKCRIREIYGHPDIEERMEVLEYKDMLADMDKAVMELSEMASRFTEFSKGQAGKEIYLHADVTGGFRHASMMMLAIMQLTKFLGIRMGRILYSEPAQHTVYVANKIHAMFDLISGVDEFVQFGSVNALRRYFSQSSDEQSREMKELLAAMQNFSDAIRLCRTESIPLIMSNLREKIEAFGRSGGNSSEEKVFLQLLQRVKAEYEMVTQDASTELDVIQWCIKKEHWQQALTFSTERLPIYIVDHHICEPSQENYRKRSDHLHHHWQQNFIVKEILPLPQGSERVEQVKENLLEVFRGALSDGDRQIEEDLKALRLSREKFDLLIKEIENADRIVREIRGHMGRVFGKPLTRKNINKVYPSAILRAHGMFSKLLKFLYFATVHNDDQSYIYYLYSNVSRKNIIDNLLHCAPEDCVVRDEIYCLVKVLQKGRTQKTGNEKERSDEEKWQERETYWRNAFSFGLVRTAYPKKQEQIIALLRSFHFLRAERNQINHANDSSVKVEEINMNVDKAQMLVQGCLQLIREIEG